MGCELRESGVYISNRDGFKAEKSKKRWECGEARRAAGEPQLTIRGQPTINCADV
jgi:hypothetical protein